MSSLAAGFVRAVIGFKALTPKLYRKDMADKSDKGTISLPKSARFPRPVFEYRVDGMQVFEVPAAERDKPVVLYLHGGAYIHGFTGFHWKTMVQLAKKTGCGFIVPNYPLLPLHTARECYLLVMKLYSNLLESVDASRIVFMGDSAGGGLALSIAEGAKTNGMALPSKMVLISPWVDVLGGDDSLQPEDNWLYCDTLRKFGRDWAGDLDPHSAAVSPLYGEVSGLPECLVFSGDWEVLYPDTAKMVGKLRKAGVPVEFHVGTGLGHVYPLYPAPEGREARGIIVDFLSKDAGNRK